MKQLMDFVGEAGGGWEMLLIQLLVFCSVALVVAGVTLALLRRNPASKRLGKLLAEEKSEPGKRTKLLEEDEQGLVAKVTTPLHGLALPSKSDERKQARIRLIQAGFRSQRSYRNFFAIKVLLTLLLPSMFLVRGMFFHFTPQVLMISLALATFGYLAPSLALDVIIKKRQQGIIRTLPDALDLMVICVESGLGLDMTFKRVGDELRSMNKDLSDEFHLVNREVRAGRPRDESLRNMSVRTGVDEVQNLMTMLIQTNRFGTSMAKALRVHADAMRIKRRQVAEEIAAKMSVKLTIPMILFIFPAIMVVLLGPAALRIAKVLLPVMSQGG